MDFCIEKIVTCYDLVERNSFCYKHKASFSLRTSAPGLLLVWEVPMTLAVY
jgi:hypothetical protein